MQNDTYIYSWNMANNFEEFGKGIIFENIPNQIKQMIIWVKKSQIRISQFGQKSIYGTKLHKN